MATYFGYARISSEGQSRFSIEDQETYLRQRALIVGLPFVFRPEVGSGTTQKGRDVLSNLVEDVAAGDYIGVAFQDRFGRGGAEDIILLQDLHRRGVNVELRGKLFNPEDPLGSFSDEMMMIVAKFYSKLQGQKAKQGIKSAQRSGRYLFKNNLFGYRRVDADGVTRVMIDAGEATVVKLIHEKYNSGLSYPKIAETIQQAGYRGRSGKFLSVSFVRKVLLNPVYMGFLHPDPAHQECKAVDRNNLVFEELVKSVFYPAIITPEDWWRTYSSRRIMTTKYETRKLYQRRPNEITGILQCGPCARNGRKVAYIHAIHQTLSRGKLTSHYPIYTSRLHQTGCPVRPKSFKVEILEGLFRCLLILAFERPEESKSFVAVELSKQRKADTEAAQEIRQLQEVLKKHERQLERLTEAIANSDEDVLDLMGRRKEILIVVGQVRSSIERLRAPLALRRDELEVLLQRYSLDSLREFFADGTTGAQRKMIYLSMIESAVQTERSIEVTFKNGKRFVIGVQQANGRVYQTDFIIEMSFGAVDQGELVAQYSKENRKFTIHRITSDGKKGGRVPLLDLVEGNNFEAVKQGWDMLYGPEEREGMARPMNVDSFIRLNRPNA